MIRNYLLLAVLISALISFGPSQKESDQVEVKKKELFYYPLPYDLYWRNYPANIVGAEGWITDSCPRINIPAERPNLKSIDYYQNKRVKVLNSFAEHSGVGKYEGNISVRILEDSSDVIIEYNDFKPDFQMGDWLSTIYQKNF